ncbi:MAG: TRAP transporter large permease subunit [Actinomycetota bacterium]
MGGSAKISVVGSGVVASVTGSDMANAASTGAVTIPLMIRNGYSRPFAAAVEAVASNGAQLVPPIMGTAAFLMAELGGVPYSTVVLAAAMMARSAMSPGVMGSPAPSIIARTVAAETERSKSAFRQRFSSAIIWSDARAIFMKHSVESASAPGYSSEKSGSTRSAGCTSVSSPPVSSVNGVPRFYRQRLWSLYKE